MPSQECPDRRADLAITLAINLAESTTANLFLEILMAAPNSTANSGNTGARPHNRLTTKARLLGLAIGLCLASPFLTQPTWAGPPDPLADILAKKGVLTADDLKQILDSRGTIKPGALAKLLESKGLLTKADIADLETTTPPIRQIKTTPSAKQVPVYSHSDQPTTLTLGPVDLTFGGFIDYQAIYRTRDAGGIGTNFADLPYSTDVRAHTGEFRSTLQNSRLTVKVETALPSVEHRIAVAAYFETDFSGNDALNTGITSNPHTFRLRQAFLDVQRDDWEVLVGQAWGWLTPNRQGLGSYPSDVFLTNDDDANYNVGLTWVRQAAARIIYHPDPNWTMGLSIENPDQFGGLGEITFPTGFRSDLETEVGTGAGGTSIPDASPDIIPKVSFDGLIGDHRFHLETAGLLSFFRLSDRFGNGFSTHRAVGYGGEFAGNIELTPSLTAVASGFASRGGGRYIFALAPDIVVLPTASGKDVFISPVNSYSGLFGLEWMVTSKLKISGYWGFVDAERNFARDTTVGAAPGDLVGFGYPGSSTSNNHWINEPSLEITYSVWSDPKYGTLQLGTQYSYIEREPWSVATNAPTSASLSQFWWNVRYVLP